jgi:hypothetical protein
MKDIVDETHGSSSTDMDTHVSIVELPSVCGRATTSRLTTKAEQ